MKSGRRALDLRSCGLLLVVASQLFLASGCAVMKATQLPDKKDLSVLQPDVPRLRVIAELGNPVSSETVSNETVDIFAFEQGYSPEVKASRVSGHLIGDVLTVGLWEIIGAPLETVYDGEAVKVEVGYNEQNRVRRVTYLEGRHLAESGHTSPAWAQPPTWIKDRRMVEFDESAVTNDNVASAQDASSNLTDTR